MSTASAMSAFGKAARRLPSCSKKSSQTTCRIHSASTNAPTSSQSTRDSSRPPVSSVSTSATKNGAHSSCTRIDAVCASGGWNWPMIADRKKPAPAAVMSRPLRLSGRLRQAMSPHAANDPPISR